MSGRRHGHNNGAHDKYYMSAKCRTCGCETGEEYAWRFGESDPEVQCSDCAAQSLRSMAKARKHPQNHKARVLCSQCNRHYDTEHNKPSNKDIVWGTCGACDDESSSSSSSSD